MNINERNSPHKLEKYSFLWSEARLVVAALALFLGGIPPALALNPISAFSGIIKLLLTLAWIISGIASGYLLYRWNKNKRMLFGDKRQTDTINFFVMVISGLNLGIAGIFSTNIGMSLFSSRLIFTIVGVLYLASAYYLLRRYKEHGKKVF